MKIRLLVLLVVFLTSVTLAQTQESNISVTIKNQLGEVVFDAEVTLQ